MRDLHQELAAISARYRRRERSRQRRKAWAERGKLALVILACVAAMPLAIGAGLVFGAGLSP